MLCPEISLGYVQGNTAMTDPMAGITLGYRGVLSSKGLKSSAYSDVYVGAITEPVIIYGISGGVYFLYRYWHARSMPSVKRRDVVIGKKLSLFGGFFITGTDITFVDEGIGKRAVSIGQKLALPYPITEVDAR